MAPLTRGRANNPGHVPNDLMRQYYEQRATAGLIISEGTWVSEDGQGWLGAPGIYNREQGGGWKAITDAVHAKGGRIFAQLWHQGAVSHPSFFHDGRLPLAPSAIDFVAFGREYIANPDLVERIKPRAPLNEQRSEGYYGATAFGYTDYPFLTAEDFHAETEGAALSLRSGLE